MPNDDMSALTARTEKLISALTDAILSTAEAAAERISLASEVAKITQRMSAFGAVLEAIEAQRAPLLERLEKAKGASRMLALRQLEMLAEQEVAVLERAGAKPEAAHTAVVLSNTPLVTEGEATHARDGRRFKRVGAGSTNGNGTAPPPAATG